MLFYLPLLIVLLLPACSHNRSEESRAIAATSSGIGHHLDQEDQISLTEMVQEKDEKRLQQLFLATRIAQTLVASFDLRLEKVSNELGMTRIMESKLYCKLQETRANYELVEEKLEFALKAASLAGDEYERWYYAQLFLFAKKDVANEAAAGNLVRHFTGLEKELCGRLGCVESLAGKGLSVAVVRDEVFTSFMERNLHKIAQYANPIPSDLLKGDCFGPGRSPNQAAYDWKNRNWIKGNLNAGEFVVTYDDGPHQTITEELVSAWEKTDFPKPAFFWLSANAKRLSPIVQKLKRSGYVLGLHSERHADLGNLAKANSVEGLSSLNKKVFKAELENLSPARFGAWRESTLDREILGAAETLKEVVRPVDGDYRVRHFRLPFGSGVGHLGIGARLGQANLDHFFWKVDSLDWQDKNPASIHKRVVAQMKAGQKGLILFHDIQPQTIKASQLLIETFRNTSGWKPVSITQMVP